MAENVLVPVGTLSRNASGRHLASQWFYQPVFCFIIQRHTSPRPPAAAAFAPAWYTLNCVDLHFGSFAGVANFRYNFGKEDSLSSECFSAKRVSVWLSLGYR